MDQVTPLSVGEPIRRELHGLEAFFRHQAHAPPPRWKMALVTWLGVYPTVLFWSCFLPGLLNGVPHLASVAIANVLVVATLAWVAMPLLTRFFFRWLHARPPKSDRASRPV